MKWLFLIEEIIIRIAQESLAENEIIGGKKNHVCGQVIPLQDQYQFGGCDEIILRINLRRLPGM